VIWDSLGITLYLADRFPAVWPEAVDARAWAMCAAAEMHAGFATLRNACTMNVGVRVEPNPPGVALRRDIDRLTELWNEGLQQFGGPFLAGDRFTAVDAFFAPVAYRVRTYGLDMGPAGQVWVERMLALPAMQQWEAEALAESWREDSHEAELAAAGRIIADYRNG
jgi:glutathione S-transferase